MRRRLVVLVLAVAAACGGGGGGKGGGTTTTGGPATGGATATDGASTSSTATDGRPLERADCLRLLDRYLELELAELRATRPAEEIPTDEQVAAIRADMEKEDLAGCIGQPRAPFECAMRADSKAALRACFAGP